MKHYQKYLFGQLDGQDVEAYRLENDLGYQLSVMTYGATIIAQWSNLSLRSQ